MSRKLLGHNIDREFQRAYDQAFSKSVRTEAFAWLYLASSGNRGLEKQRQMVWREILNRSRDTPSSTLFHSGEVEDPRSPAIPSKDKTNAIVLLGLLKNEQTELSERVVMGMLGGKVQDWDRNPNAAGYKLFAVSRYFAEREKAVPDFAVRNWVAGNYFGEAQF